MLPEGDDDVLMRDQLRMPSCPGKSGQAGRETSRDRKRVAENLGNEGVGKSEGANESCRSVKEGLTEMSSPKKQVAMLSTSSSQRWDPHQGLSRNPT